MLRSGNNFDLLLPTKLRSHLQNSWEPVFRPSRFEAPLTTLSARGYAGSDLLSVAYWVPGAGPGLMAINRPLAKRPRIRSLDEQRAQHSGRTELNFETGCVIGPAIFFDARRHRRLVEGRSGTSGSNPASSNGESAANPSFCRIKSLSSLFSGSS
jgi:hypothetical protein